MNTFILALFSVEDKLRCQTIYQLLVGKRTSSVICYAFFYDRLHLFGSLPDLSEATFFEEIDKLSESGWLNVNQGLAWRTTKSTVPPNQLDYLLDEVDYYRFGRKEAEIWRSLQFLIQSVSYLGTGKGYAPLENSPFYTERVRQFTYGRSVEVKNILHDEMTTIFHQLPAETAQLLAQTLTGNHQNGFAFFQLFRPEYLEAPWFNLRFSALVHAFYQGLMQHKNFLIYQYLRPLFHQNLNQSMLQTRKCFLQGASFNQVMQERHLKQGTIQDHLIEWSIMDEAFDFQRYISQVDLVRKLPEAPWKLSYRELAAQSNANFIDIRLYQIWRKKCSWS